LVTLEFQCIELGKQPLDASANLAALSPQGCKFLPHLIGSGHLFPAFGVSMFHTGLGAGRAGFGLTAQLALPADQLDRAHNALFKSSEVVGAERDV